jgi:rRNA maturation RNase YbeY
VTGFEIDIHQRCLCPSGIARVAEQAAQTTLAMIPKKTLSSQLDGRRPPYLLELSFISSQAMRKLNHHYRKKDRPTDVLSFSQKEAGALVLGPQVGEVLVCVNVARRQAKEARISLKREIQQLVVHGVLHVFGYDHETNDRDAKKMFGLQNRIMAKLP